MVIIIIIPLNAGDKESWMSYLSVIGRNEMGG